jgi:hypothetical protein
MRHVDFNPSDQTSFPGNTPDERWTNYNVFRRLSVHEKVKQLWQWGIITTIHDENRWMKRLSPAASPEELWEVETRRRLQAEITERKKAEAEAEASRDRAVKRATLQTRLTEVIASGDSSQEVEVRLQLARLDKADLQAKVARLDKMDIEEVRQSRASPMRAPVPPQQKGGGGAVALFILGIIGCIALFFFADWLGGLGVAIIIAAFFMRRAGQSAQVVVVNNNAPPRE